jgi:chromosome segregation ATPase
LAVRDTQTPPLLNAIYEQITRVAAGYSNLVECSDLSYEHNEEQAITDCSLDHSYLADGRGLHDTLVQTENQEREALDEQPEKYTLKVQHIYAQFVDTQNTLRQLLELSRAREHKLHADLLAAEQEHETLKALASGKDHNIQSITEESQVAHVRLKNAEYKIARLNAKLQREHDRLLRKRKEWSDEQVRVQDRHESEMHRLTQEAQNAQEQLGALNAKVQRDRDRRLRKRNEWLDEQVRVQDHHESEMHRLTQEAQNAQEQLDALREEVSRLRADGQSRLDHDHLPCHQPPTTRSPDAVQPPLPPEQNPDTGTPGPPIGSAINLDSSLRSTKSSPHAPCQDQEVSPSHLLQEELVATKELLRLAEEEVLTVRHDLGQSRGTLREVKTRIRSLQSEWDMCQALLREAQDARCADMIKLAEVLELLRASQAESESSMAEAEESQFRCSQATSLCAALQERVTELEAEVKNLRHTYIQAPSDVESALDSYGVSDKCRYEVPLRGVVDPSKTRPPSLLRAFLSKGSSLGSVDWPPIGSSLLPAGTNVRLDDDSDIGVQVSDAPPRPL